MVLRKWLEIAIEDLKKDVNKMASLVTNNITNSLESFRTNNVKLAEEIKKRDIEVDQLEDEISKKVIKIIWKEQPIAKDLRLVTGIYKLITDLERIGDHAIDIANITIKTHGFEEKRLLPLTSKMADIALKMVENSVAAFFTFNKELSQKTILLDDEVDKLFDEITKLAISEFKSGETEPGFGVYLLFVAKYIERIADHATNICEWIIYIVSGNHPISLID